MALHQIAARISETLYAWKEGNCLYIPKVLGIFDAARANPSHCNIAHRSDAEWHAQRQKKSKT